MNTLHPGITAKKIDDSRDIDQVFGHDDGCAHVDFQVGMLKSTRCIKSEPFRVDGGATVSVGQSACTCLRCIAKAYILPSSQLWYAVSGG